MKHVTALIGTARTKHTYGATRRFLDDLQALGGVECELVSLGDCHLEICRGCKLCFVKGEEFCPLKDDRDVLVGKMMASDGVVFATPNYSFQVSAVMKIFLDRLGFVFHRPRFFGKSFTSIVAQGIYGGAKIVQYLDFVGGGLGFNTVNGTYFTALEPMTAEEEGRINGKLAAHARRFHERLGQPSYPAPTLFQLWGFRMARTSIRLGLDDSNRDHTYYREKGWYESDYFYPVRLGPLRKAAGTLFDTIAARSTRKRECR